MPTEPSKYAGNQFDAATADSFPLMSEVLIDTLPRIIAAALIKPALVPARDAVQNASNAWNNGETALATAEAVQMGATLSVNAKLVSLTRKPDAETNSILEGWDIILLGQAPSGSALYTMLLPHGRETLTAGTIDEQIDALRDFAVRLSMQAFKPLLFQLGTAVGTFAQAARTLRTAQLTAKTNVLNARANQEVLRKTAAAELFSMVGLGMTVYKLTPGDLDLLFDVNLLRQPQQPLPTAPADTLWTPLARLLSTSAMPAAATRLEAWREGPGGMPERLAIGETGAIEVLVPATVTFNPGDSYQLWLVARNSRGVSAPGPVTTWVAPQANP